MMSTLSYIYYFTYTELCSGQFILFCCCLVAKSCLTLWPLDCSPSSSSVHGIFQARILEWVAASSSRGYSQPRDWIWVYCLADKLFTTEPPGTPFILFFAQPRDQTHISCVSCIASEFFTHWAIKEVLHFVLPICNTVLTQKFHCLKFILGKQG